MKKDDSLSLHSSTLSGSSVVESRLSQAFSSQEGAVHASEQPVGLYYR